MELLHESGGVVGFGLDGTLFLMCLMETGPVAGVGFALMAGKVTPWAEL